MAPSALVLLHAVSDGVIALSLLAIPVALLYINKRRGESSPGETALVTLFALFIFAVGLAHLAALLGIWVPSSGLEGLLKAAAALLALTTAIVIWKLAPRLRASLARPATGRGRRPFAHLRRAESIAASARGARRGAHQGIGGGASSASRSRCAARRSPCSARTRICALPGRIIRRPASRRRRLAGKTDAEVLPGRSRQDHHGGQAKDHGHRRRRSSSRPISSCSAGSAPSIS